MQPPSTPELPEKAAHHGSTPRGKYLASLSLLALGIVYGDIGTSPLYALRECFHGDHRVPVTDINVFGVLSLIFWSLIIIISIKYLVFVLRADNRGEGGIIALMSLVRPHDANASRWRKLFVLMGLFGAALLYGDGIITPAISVLSAVEGLSVATPVFDGYVLPITIVILVTLFWFQKKGTGAVGKIFGPVTLIWFLVLAALGVSQIIQEPRVLSAVFPSHAIRFFAENGSKGMVVLGTVFLAVTGAEALYADIGHFGILPIRLSWFALVLPSLVMNYFGQGALLLRDPLTAENPFFRMAPTWSLFPLVAIATAATVIASQAVISGAFSLTRQAIQLGYLPRLEIDHTSARQIGQIYIPAVNWALMLACIGLVLAFRSSSKLASAYGVAVTTDMVFTTILFGAFTVLRWRWKLWWALIFVVVSLTMDLSFWGANLIKVPDGGWFPLVVAAIVFMLMTTWHRGRKILSERLREESLPPELFLMSIERKVPHRVPGVAVFLYRNPEGTPSALLHSLKHYKVLHDTVVFLSVMTEEVPHVSSEERTEITPLGQGIFRLVVRYGFMEDPDIPEVLATIKTDELAFPPADTSYFLGRETLIATKRPGMAIWRERLFAWMNRNARSALLFFRLPANRVVELGAQIEL
ncbi:MAG: potassium transporter Kup [Acidobacteriota bacterium]